MATCAIDYQYFIFQWFQDWFHYPHIQSSQIIHVCSNFWYKAAAVNKAFLRYFKVKQIYYTENRVQAKMKRWGNWVESTFKLLEYKNNHFNIAAMQRLRLTSPTIVLITNCLINHMKMDCLIIHMKIIFDWNNNCNCHTHEGGG